MPRGKKNKAAAPKLAVTTKPIEVEKKDLRIDTLSQEEFAKLSEEEQKAVLEEAKAAEAKEAAIKADVEVKPMTSSAINWFFIGDYYVGVSAEGNTRGQAVKIINEYGMSLEDNKRKVYSESDLRGMLVVTNSQGEVEQAQSKEQVGAYYAWASEK
jgi:hypothetical protein